MQTTDILLYETGNGGDLAILNDDLQTTEALYQQVYFALFGGNLEASTKPKYIDSEDRFDYWGNSLVWNDRATRQFNSQTERAIKSNSVNSSGRLAIIQAINEDLRYLESMANFAVEVLITGVESLSIKITFTSKTNQEDKVLQFLYDNSKNELIINKEI